MAKQAKQTEAEWWKEEAARKDAIGRTAAESGYIIDVGEGNTPALNPDGSLKQDSRNGKKSRKK